MTLKLHYHPLATFCWKVQLALYENATPFEPVIVDLGDPESREAFLKLSPSGKMPALEDAAAGRVVVETSIIIEYLDQRYPGPVRLIPGNPDLALACRGVDRFYDLYVQQPMQKVVADTFRPQGAHDPQGVEEAIGQLRAAYDRIEREMIGGAWALGEAFSMADCAAMPALFYADQVTPAAGHPKVVAYLERLMARPSARRVIAEAKPYFPMFPLYSERMERL